MKTLDDIRIDALAALRSIMLLVLIAVPVGADVVELPGIQDAHTNNLHPNQNFGHDIDMYLGEAEEVGRSNVYIQFDLSAVQGIIDRAELQLFQRETGSGSMGMRCDLYRMPTPWNEGAITWANQPAAPPGTIDWQRVGGYPSPRWIVWDATPLVRGWVNNAWPNHGMVLIPYEFGIHRYALLYSSEYSGELFPPKLMVWFSQATAVEGSTWGRIKAQFN